MSGLRHWVLCEAPFSFRALNSFLSNLPKGIFGVFVRFGRGLDPFVIAPKIRSAGFEPGLFLHLRDMNQIALASVLHTAVATEIQRIFLGEPAPIKDVESIRSYNSLDFIAFAKSKVGTAIRFGACFCLSHPQDEMFLKRSVNAGIQTVAVRPDALGKRCLDGLEAWQWVKGLGKDKKIIQSHPAFIDLSEVSENSGEVVFNALSQILKD